MSTLTAQEIADHEAETAAYNEAQARIDAQANIIMATVTRSLEGQPLTLEHEAFFSNGAHLVVTATHEQGGTSIHEFGFTSSDNEIRTGWIANDIAFKIAQDFEIEELSEKLSNYRH
jgi:hypothetical protein